MEEYLVYILTFMAVMIPAVLYCMSDKSVKVKKTKNLDEQLPFMLQVAEPFARVMEKLGLASIAFKLSPASANDLGRKLEFCALKISAKTVYCSQIFLAAALALIFAVMGFAISDEAAYMTVGALVGAFLGWFSPKTQIDKLADEKRVKILQTLPYSIDLISSAMRGGLDFMAAVRFYVNIAEPGPLSYEFLHMLHEMELGVNRIAALRNMAERVQIKEFSSFVSAIELGTELGSPLTETMEIQGEEMRKARFALAECKAQRAPSLMLLPMAIFIMPAVFIIILTPIYLRMKEAGVSLF